MLIRVLGGTTGSASISAAMMAAGTSLRWILKLNKNNCKTCITYTGNWLLVGYADFSTPKVTPEPAPAAPIPVFGERNCQKLSYFYSMINQCPVSGHWFFALWLPLYLRLLLKMKDICRKMFRFRKDFITLQVHLPVGDTPRKNLWIDFLSLWPIVLYE